jgi:DNA-binding transcriptional regulator YhcF (GntR family)
MGRDLADLRLSRDDELPLGTQLAVKLRSWIGSRELAPGDQLPSLRELAVAAGVNVNTIRAVYLRLENEGLVRTEHGRGTFVATPGSSAGARRELRRQIAQLEASLVKLPPLPSEAEGARSSGSPGAGLLSEAELEAVRDRLQERLLELDRQRAEVARRLEVFEPAPAKQSTSSITGARVRWVSA